MSMQRSSSKRSGTTHWGQSQVVVAAKRISESWQWQFSAASCIKVTLCDALKWARLARALNWRSEVRAALALTNRPTCRYT